MRVADIRRIAAPFVDGDPGLRARGKVLVVGPPQAPQTPGAKSGSQPLLR